MKKLLFALSLPLSMSAQRMFEGNYISASGTGGTPPYAYHWNHWGNQPSIFSVVVDCRYPPVYSPPAGLNAIDANGCMSPASANFYYNIPVQIQTYSSANPSNCNGNNGTITVNVCGGSGNYNYTISPGGTYSSSSQSYTFTGLSAKTYTVTVQDGNGCYSSAQVFTLTQPAALSVSVTGGPFISCGSNSAYPCANATGGTAPYTYNWQYWGPNPSCVNVTTKLVSNGTYSVTVTDANGCTATASYHLEGMQISFYNLTNVSCYGGNNGTAFVAVWRGSGFCNYSWTPSGGTTANASGLSAGTYTCTVYDVNEACTQYAVITITQPNPLVVSASTTANVKCNGDNNGSASSTISGGTTPYTYSWSNSKSTPTISGLSAGTYTLNVTDNNGCTGSAMVTITQSATVLKDSIKSTCATCCNCKGTTHIYAWGGTSPYTYLWNNGRTNDTLVGLSSGTYSCTVTDANGCSITDTVWVSKGSPATITATSVGCFGGNTGSASVSVSGNYTYIWSPNGGTGATASGLTAGTYTVTLTNADTTSCSQSLVVKVNQPPQLLVYTVSGGLLYVCGSGCDNVTASVSGGTPPYTYLWSNHPSNNSNTQCISTSTYTPPTNVTLTVFDAHGCSGTSFFGFNSLELTMNPHKDATCSNNGVASVTAWGGENNYTYSWSPSGGTKDTAYGLSAGTYTVSVTDNFGYSPFTCTQTATVTITQPNQLNVTANTTANVSCNDGNNGRASSTVTGGTTPYTYSWSNSQSTPTISGLSSGTYTLNVTDSNGCTGTATVVITQPNVLNVTGLPDNNVTCFGGFNGVANATVSGGTMPYTYEWSPTYTPEGPGPLTGMSAGTYTIIVQDNNGCTNSSTVLITQPAQISIIGDSINDNGSCNGSAWVKVNGGISPYTYAWTGGNTTDSIGNQCHGGYCCTVTDANGCIDSVCITINLSTGISVVSAGSESVKVYPNPNNGVFTIKSSAGSGQSLVEIYNVLGENIYKSNINSVNTEINLSNQPNGVYFYRVLKDNGSRIVNGKIVIQR